MLSSNTISQKTICEPIEKGVLFLNINYPSWICNNLTLHSPDIGEGGWRVTIVATTFLKIHLNAICDHFIDLHVVWKFDFFYYLFIYYFFEVGEGVSNEQPQKNQTNGNSLTKPNTRVFSFPLVFLGDTMASKFFFWEGFSNQKHSTTFLSLKWPLIAVKRQGARLIKRGFHSVNLS